MKAIIEGVSSALILCHRVRTTTVDPEIMALAVQAEKSLELAVDQVFVLHEEAKQRG